MNSRSCLIFCPSQVLLVATSVSLVCDSSPSPNQSPMSRPKMSTESLKGPLSNSQSARAGLLGGVWSTRPLAKLVVLIKGRLSLCVNHSECSSSLFVSPTRVKDREREYWQLKARKNIRGVLPHHDTARQRQDRHRQRAHRTSRRS